MTAPETALRDRVRAVLTATFSDLDVRDDKIHDSLGQDGRVAGIYPADATEGLGRVVDQVTTCYVQIFDQWDKEIDPEQTVSPGTIEALAQRFRRACEADGGFLGDENLWYYRVTRVEYPPDPTGNITRLLATVVAESTNAAVVETTG